MNCSVGLSAGLTLTRSLIFSIMSGSFFYMHTWRFSFAFAYRYYFASSGVERPVWVR